MSSKEQQAICHMFDAIADTYDPVNRILSFRQDVRWRNVVADFLPTKEPLSVLDIATGTADLLLCMLKKRSNIKQAFGVDLSEKMLGIGQKKITQQNMAPKASLKKADACALPCADNSFDIVTIAFGIRNVVDFRCALREIVRVLKPNGTALILEFSLPQLFFIRQCYLFYFRYILPSVGRLLSKEKNAYRYLNRTVESFPCGPAFTQIMNECGFKTVKMRSLSFGIATIYCARKC